MFGVPKIRHFDNNIKRVLQGFTIIDSKVMNHDLKGLDKSEKINRHLQYIKMICFSNAQQEYEEDIAFAKEQVLFAYTEEIVQGQNINDKDCSQFELDRAKVQNLMDNGVAFMKWMKTPVESISDKEVSHVGWGSVAHTQTMKWRHYKGTSSIT